MVKFRNMKSVDTQALPAPPSLMTSLMAGFDAITNHIALILFPLALDLFLLFGPHLSLRPFIAGFLGIFDSLPGMQAPENVELVRLTREFWTLVGDRFNLFTVLRTYPVGIPSLMAGNQPVQNPLGVAPVVTIGSLAPVVGGWLLVALLGLGLGAIYYAVVAQAVLKGDVRWSVTLRDGPWFILQVVFLALFWLALFVAFSFSGSCFISVVSLTGLAVSQIGLIIFIGLVIWSLFPLFFSAHGIFVERMSMWQSVKESIRLTRLTSTKTAFFFLLIILINEGLGVLWRVPDETSWMSLIGIAGHAFVVSALLAASFVYYRDASRWVRRMIQQAMLSAQR